MTAEPKLHRWIGTQSVGFSSVGLTCLLCLGLTTGAFGLNSNPTLSDAGLWVPVTNNSYLSANYNGTLANTFHALLPLGSSGEYGMVVTGWGYSGWPATLTTTAPISVAILSPDSSGNFGIHTANYLSDPVTNGAGSAIVADFNGDGKPDIFLAAHNESPFIAMPSTAWLSNASGGFDKVTLPDHVMAHDAELIHLNGQPAVITSTFGGDNYPVYTFNNGQFVETIATNILWSTTGMSTVVDQFGTNGSYKLIRGDVMRNYHPDGTVDSSTINVYPFSGTDITSETPDQVIVPYLSTLPQYQTYSSMWGPGITHTYRVWADDLNHDGKPDILAGQSMWNLTDPNFPSILQVLMNTGNGTFQDATATLNPEMRFNTSEMDYNPTFVDIDHSGINTYLFAGSMSWGSVARQSDYVLLNDGTGRLYVGLHDEFTALAPQVFAFLDLPFTSNSTPPRFIGIPQVDGTLNFVAEVPTSTFNTSASMWQSAYQYVNVPLRFNQTTDFKRDVTVNNRNGSMLMRTWAGSDTFHDTNASNSATTIDGGLGVNTSVYSGRRSDYTVARNADATVSVIGNGLSDRLKNIQILQFSDQTVSGVPAVPVISTITPGHGRSSFNFAALGGQQLITYTVTCTAKGHPTLSASGTSAPIVVRAMAGGVAYSCSIVASNGMASSAPSAAMTVILKSLDLTPILMLLLD